MVRPLQNEAIGSTVTREDEMEWEGAQEERTRPGFCRSRNRRRIVEVEVFESSLIEKKEETNGDCSNEVIESRSICKANGLNV
jgi:hypothetical protein